MSMVFLNKNSMDSSARTNPHGKGLEKTAQQEDVASFLQAMGTSARADEEAQARAKQDSQHQSGQDEAEDKPSQQDDQDTKAHSMSNPFESLFANQMQKIVASTTSASQAPQDLPELASKLADRILVSQPDAAQQEVRISLGKDIMPDTEICLQRDLNGQLNIIITSKNPSSFQTLVAEQHTLRQLLEKQEGAEVRVEIQQGETEDDGDKKQRSRGYYVAPEEENGNL
jgi:type III secretion system needle length determinant